MITHVYDQPTETMFYVTNIQLQDETINENGTILYNIDLASFDDEMTIYNVPLTITMEKGTITGYAMADIYDAIDLMITADKDTYDYNYENNSTLYDCKYDDGMITSVGEPFLSEPHTSVSIYQNGKEPLTQEATTIPDLIEILKYANTLDYTEIVISGAFTSKSKNIRMVGKNE